MLALLSDVLLATGPDLFDALTTSTSGLGRLRPVGFSSQIVKGRHRSNIDARASSARRWTDKVKSASPYVHNHTGEFDNRFPYDHSDGKPVMTSAWEIVAANTDTRFVQFEVDIFWARLAFKPDRLDDLLAFLTKYRSRIALLHMKNLAANGAVTDMGVGTTDWRRVIEAAGPQIAYYIYEFNFPSNPAKSAKIGFDYLSCGTQISG